MSARTPFFTSGTRKLESVANGDQPEATKSQFPADKCNPLHSDPGVDISASSAKGEKSTIHDAENKLLSESNTNDARNKPLNVSGLIRSRTQSRPPQRIPVNSVNGNNIVRPGTADLTRNIQSFDTHTITIAAPTPFNASKMTTSLLTNTSNPDISPRDPSPFDFKAPSLPHVLPNDDLLANNAHIPVETRNSSHTADVPGHPRAFNGLVNRSTPSRMLDRNGIEDAVHAMNRSGPQQNLNSLKRRKLEPENNGRSEQPQKHPRRLKENHQTRNNTIVEEHEQEHIYSRADRVSDYRYPANTSMGSSEIGPSIDALPYHDTENVKMEQQDLVLGLDRLLGCDVNVFVEERLIEKYEQAVTRWRESTVDQWFAGTDEIMSKYTKILDFVKDHMGAKIALYASCTKKIDQHGSVLKKREEILSGFQARLVKESESILGRSLGM